MNIYNTKPQGNQMASLEPARYFNLAIEKIEEAEESLKKSKQNCQYLLVHVDAFVHFAKQHPEMASRRVAALDIIKITKTFNDWYERVNSKIPAEYREGIKQNADELFAELEKYGH